MEHCLVASPYHPVQAPSLLPPTHLHQCRVGCELQCDLHKAVLVFLAHDGDLDEDRREEGGSEAVAKGRVYMTAPPPHILRETPTPPQGCPPHPHPHLDGVATPPKGCAPSPSPFHTLTASPRACRTRARVPAPWPMMSSETVFCRTRGKGGSGGEMMSSETEFCRTGGGGWGGRRE